jgi:hypothetical protein
VRTRFSTTRSCASSVDPENSPDGDCRLKKRRLCFRIAGSEQHGLPTILLEDNVDLAVAATLLPGVLLFRELAIEARATVVSSRGRSPSAPPPEIGVVPTLCGTLVHHGISDALDAIALLHPSAPLSAIHNAAEIDAFDRGQQTRAGTIGFIRLDTGRRDAK